MVPFKNSPWFHNNVVSKEDDRVFELDWFENKIFSDKLRFHFVPAQHWSSGRRPAGRFTHLWGGWVVEGVKYGKKIFFAGDTGYCDVFKLIGEKFGGIDVSFIPIGTYHPRWFLCP